MNKEQLLNRIREMCINTEDIFTMDDWSTLTYQELRTVVTLLDNGGVAMITELTPSSQKSQCFLLEQLARYVRLNPSRFSQTQRRNIKTAYRRNRSALRSALIPESEVPPNHPPPPPPLPVSTSSTGGGGGRVMRFGPGTVLQINGVRRTTAGSGTLSITTTRSGGRDRSVIIINYT